MPSRAEWGQGVAKQIDLSPEANPVYHTVCPGSSQVKYGSGNHWHWLGPNQEADPSCDDSRQ